jgi:hypothetical protein
MLENDFGMDNEFGDTSLLDFFNNKSGESENVDVDVNDHRDENLDHYSEVVINDLYNQCQSVIVMIRVFMMMIMVI